MHYDNILFDVAGGVATITLNRPAKLNAFTAAMHADLRDALERVRGDGSVRALVLTGAGRGFCAGQDLTETQLAGPGAAPSPDSGKDRGEGDVSATLERNYHPLVLGLRALPMPVICAVNGVAAGAGCNVALACDVVLAARSASFIEIFSRIALIPDAGGTYFLPRLAGLARAMGLALTADKLGAEQAEQWGLIWRCFDDDRLMPEARALALQFATGPTRAYGLIKRALYASAGNSLEQQLALEANLQREAGRSPDFREGVQAFLDKRPARFTGR
jgi:2-(1,2-epoxy-1,2-dihydrophenyl)acetyl-CoA isomerase